MSVYLDTSVLVSLFIMDTFGRRARAFLDKERPIVVTSDFGEAEFSAVVARRVRTGDLTEAEAHEVYAKFDGWISGHAAITLLRRLDTALRAPDALHIAIAIRAQAALFTFDRKMAASATALGLALAAPV